MPPGKDPHSSQDAFPVVILRFHEPFAQPPDVDAGLGLSSLSYEPKAAWTRIEATRITVYERGELPEVGISGTLKASDEQMKLMYELYFRCSHFR